MAKKFHAGIDARREQESKDSSMISGKGSFANMPQEVIMKDWSTPNHYLPENLNDKASGIDAQKSLDNPARIYKPKKV